MCGLELSTTVVGHCLDTFERTKHKALFEVEEGVNEFAEINQYHRKCAT